MDRNHLLRAISDHLVEHVLFITQQLYLHEESAAKLRAFSVLGDGLESQDVIFALFGTKLDLFHVDLAFEELVQVETFLLTNQVLRDGSLALSGGDYLIVGHLDSELELALSIWVLVADIVIEEDERLAPGYLCDLIHLLL